MPILEAITAEIEGYMPKHVFWQKELLVTETPSFSSFSISAEIVLSAALSFRFWQKEGEISLSVYHYSSDKFD